MILETLHAISGLLSLGPVSDADIDRSEKELSVSFAPEYRKYTSEFGAVAFGGKEFTGAVQPEYLNVVAVTKAARTITPNYRPDWYVVMDPHIDGIIVWQGGEGKIYQSEPGKESRIIADSLEEYMKKSIGGA